MRKIGIIVLLLLVIGSGVAAYIFLNPSVKKGYLVENILPEGPIVFLSLRDVEKNIQKFSTTHFWQKIQSLDYKGILALTGARGEEVQIYQSLIDQLVLPANQEILSNFFGQEIAVAVYPISFDITSPAMFQEMTNNVFFVTRLKPKAKFAEFISGFMSRLSPGMKLETVKYKNHTITLASGEGGLTIGYVSFNDLLVFGVGDKAAKACVDVVSKTAKPLTEDNLYTQAKGSFLSGAGAAIYANFEKFTSLLKNQALKMAPAGTNAEVYEKEFNNMFRQLQGFQSLGYSSRFDDFIKFKVDIHFDKTKMDPSVAKIYDCPPGQNESLSFIPANTIGYQWNNCYSFKESWEQAKIEMAASASGAAPGPGEAITGIEQSLGLSIENDIIPAIGDEFGGALTDVKMTETFPLPQLFFFVEIANRAKADKILAALLAKQPIMQLQTEDYENTTIKYVTLPLLVTNLEPAYAYLGKYFVLSLDRQLLKEAVNTIKDPARSLAANPKIKDIDFNMAKASNAAFFVDFQKVMTKLEELVNWSNKWTAGESTKREAFKAGSQKRLVDLENEIKTQEAELNGLHEQLASAQGGPVSDTPGQGVVDKAAIEEQIEKKEQDVDGSRQKVGELKILIDQYSEPVEPEADQKMLEVFVKPVIQAFQFWRVLASTTEIKNGLIESEMHLKVE